MDKRQAKIILILENTEPTNRNAYFIAGKLNIKFPTAYQELRILTELNILKKIKNKQGKVFFQVINEEALEKAKRILKEENVME